MHFLDEYNASPAILLFANTPRRSRILFGLSISIFCVPCHVGMAFERSSWAKKKTFGFLRWTHSR